ncbi:WD40/YVTN/Zinc finger containing protein; RING/FYVE/PHD-type domain containing protein [Cryptosporidium hominis]|uniref:WD40/YVTN/Zinc finger containing protein n=2 Tax=Cryptosporidium hominis TaxID=237895 RepID=A0ABX5BJ30_CRYHO|nr:WD40/YVTN/Zinc finger containing protein; RING/FYVE/PHD-type domain containing protein [Cryptosporidium hominis]|eukprot:PPS98130.1 WD40/YVTN/Zinc finger containing protein; RING/FYVE/PHD-type domain containing protein [Cryptosporidium hominis]
MLNSVDVDKSGRFGIFSKKDVYIYNLDRWKNRIDDGLEFIKVDKGKKIGLKKSTEASSNLNSIFMDEYDHNSSKYPEIVKFGTHPSMYGNFINIQGNLILYGSLESIGLDCISTQMMNISSFDWSPHFSTGTFVTSCEDALIRISDIRSKSLDLSFMSFYNTNCIKWNPLNSYLIGALHENGEFLSIYDLRVLKSTGIISRNQWLNDGLKRKERETKCGEKGNTEFTWLPLSSDKVLISETDYLCIIDFKIAIESSNTAYNSIADCSNNLRVRNGAQYISLTNPNISPDFEILNFSSSSVEEDDDLGEDEGNGLINQGHTQVDTEMDIQDLNWKNRTNIKVNTFDFLPGTNDLIINDKNGRFYFSEIKYCDDLELTKLKLKYSGPVKRIFSRENNGLTIFGGLKAASHSSISYFESEEKNIKYDFYATSLPRINNKRNITEDKRHKMSNLTLQSFCLDWFYRDLNMIYEKVKLNQQMANNLISISIESNERIIAKLSRHPSLRGKFVMEDNTNLNLVIDSFEFTIILTTQKNNIKATYYFTNNTILLIKEIFSYLSIIEKSELNINSCGQEFKKLQNYDYTSLNYLHVKEKNYMQNLIPVRVYVDNIILNGKEREKLCELFRIELDKELLISLFSETVISNKAQVSKQLIDWVWIISSLPELIFGLLIQNDGSKKEQQLELISSTRKHVYGIGFEQQAIVGENYEKKTRISFTFNTLDKLIISQGNYLVVMKVNNEDDWNRATRYENILIEINEMLRKVEYISEERFLYGDYFKYAYVLFNWLTRVLYKQNRRRCVKDIQNFSIDPTNIEENSNLSMMLCPTAIHSYFKNKSDANTSRRQFDHINDSVTPITYKFNLTCSSSSCFDQIDKTKLFILLKKLYLEIKNNYDARILVVAIQKLSNHIKRTEDWYKLKNYSKTGSGNRLEGMRANEFISELELNPATLSEIQRGGIISDNNGSILAHSVSAFPLDLTLYSEYKSTQVLKLASEACSICLEPVFGLYTRCLSCKHGGHIKHIKDWFEDRTICPMVNCKCKCVLEEWK